MKARRRYIVAGLVVATVLAGCDNGGEQRKTTLTIANVAPSYAFLAYGVERDGSADSVLPFLGAAIETNNGDTYELSVSEPQLNSSSHVDVTLGGTLNAALRYTVVIGEDGGFFWPRLLQYAPPPSDQSQVVGVHAAEGAPDVDVYVTAAGAGIAGADPVATLAFKDELSPQTIAAGDYEITLTAAGDPDAVLLRSEAVALAPATSNVLVVAGDAGESASEFSVLLLNGEDPAQVLRDRDAPSVVRVLNGAADEQPRDVALNGQFSPPLFSAVPFAAPTSFAETPASASEAINVTPAGNSGALELDETVALRPASRYTILFTGESGTLSYAAATDSRRPIADLAVVRYYNAASQFDTSTMLEIVPHGVDPASGVAATSLTVPGIGPELFVAPDDYDLYLREVNTRALRAGPMLVSLSAGGRYGVLATNGADTATADVALLDDFP